MQTRMSCCVFGEKSLAVCGWEGLDPGLPTRWRDRRAEHLPLRGPRVPTSQATDAPCELQGVWFGAALNPEAESSSLCRGGRCWPYTPTTEPALRLANFTFFVFAGKHVSLVN